MPEKRFPAAELVREALFHLVAGVNFIRLGALTDPENKSF
jgi:hypothetical protein